jgi:hypothetical protein
MTPQPTPDNSPLTLTGQLLCLLWARQPPPHSTLAHTHDARVHDAHVYVYA